MELYNKFRSVPEEAKKPIVGGRLQGFTDINPMWRIKMLTEAFGMCGEGWYYKVTDKRLEQGANGEIAAFVDINLFVKIKGREQIDASTKSNSLGKEVGGFESRTKRKKQCPKR